MVGAGPKIPGLEARRAPDAYEALAGYEAPMAAGSGLYMSSAEVVRSHGR